MVNTRLAKAYKSLMEEYEKQEDYERNMQVDGAKSFGPEEENDMSMEDYFEQQEEIEEINRQEEEIKKKIEECKERLRKQHIMSHDEQLIAVIDSVLSDTSIDITSYNLDIILSALPEQSKISTEYNRYPIEVGMDLMSLRDIGELYKECQIGLESIDGRLLLDRDFMKGYIRAYSGMKRNLNDRVGSDVEYTNQYVIDHVNSLCNEISR